MTDQEKHLFEVTITQTNVVRFHATAKNVQQAEDMARLAFTKPNNSMFLGDAFAVEQRVDTQVEGKQIS